MLPELANAVSIGERALQVCLCECVCVYCMTKSNMLSEMKLAGGRQALELPPIVCLHLLMQMKPKTVAGIPCHSCDYLVNSLFPEWGFKLRDIGFK